MLDYEYLQCDLTLRSARGDSTAFFAFAETVTAKVHFCSNASGCCGCSHAATWNDDQFICILQAYNRDNECHGWLGIKYQSSPR